MKLAKREKIYVILCVLTISVYVVLHFLVFPLIEKRKTLNQNIVLKTKILNDINLLKAEFDDVQQRAAEAKVKISQRQKNFRLYSFLDRLANESGLKGHVEKMQDVSSSKDKESQYKISSVEMKLKDVTLEQLVPFLYKIESSNNSVTIRKVIINDDKKNVGYINVSLMVVTLET